MKEKTNSKKWETIILIPKISSDIRFNSELTRSQTKQKSMIYYISYLNKKYILFI